MEPMAMGNREMVGIRHFLVQTKDVVLAYLSLTKPGIVALLLLTTLVAMVLAEGDLPSLPLVLSTMVGGAMAAGGAGAINGYLDRDVDALMARTKRRPIPMGRVEPRYALVFGIVLSGLSFLVFLGFVNLLSGVLTLVGVAYYTLLYTAWLKRRTPQSIVVGGGAGGIAPLVGWAAATNEVGLLAIFLFVIIFCWTPPHFWALALLLRADYEQAKLPVLPVVAGIGKTKGQILVYSLILLVLTLLPFFSGTLGLIYLGAAIFLGVVLVGLALLLWREPSLRWAGPLFWYSNAYLALLFFAMVISRVTT